MKIGYLLQAGPPRLVTRPFSGPAVHVREVCRGLQRRGHDVRVLVVSEGRICLSAEDGAFERFDPVEQLTERMVRKVAGENAAFATACRRLLRDRDVFYERLGWMGFGGVIAARSLGLPIVLEANGDHLWEREEVWDHRIGRLERRLYLASTRRALESAKQVVASGQGWRGRLIERFRLPPTRVTVVHNGSCLVEALQRDALRSFSAAPSAGEVVRLVYVGGFYPWHGVPRLLDVFTRLVKEGQAVELRMIGAGPGVHAANQMVATRGLEKRVSFHGELAPRELGALLAAADIGVTAYWGTVEFVGLKLFDYKAAGLAIVATGENGQPEVLEHGRTGIIVPPMDDDALHHALESLIVDGERRRALGRAARADAELTNSWKNTTDAVEAILQAVISQSHGG